MEILIKLQEKIGGFFKTRYFIAMLSGMSAVGALPPYHWIFCVFVSFSVLMFLLDRAETKKQAAGLGAAYGFGYFSLGLAWVTNALLIDGMGFKIFAPLPPLGFGLWGALFPACACLIAVQAQKGTRRLLAFSAAWGVLEWVRSWLFSGFPWNLTASVWAAWPDMLQTLSLFGPYGLSIVTVFISGLPALAFRYGRPSKADFWRVASPFFGLFLILFVLFVFGRVRLLNAPLTTDTVRGAKIRLVQPNLSQEQKWSKDDAERNLMKHVHLSRETGADTVSHIVWPESATPFLLAQDVFARSMVTSALLPSSILLAGSLRLEPKTEKTPRRLYNSLVALNDLGVFLGSYDKSHLVPFGEYVPFSFLRTVAPFGGDFSQGDGVRTMIIPRTLPVGVLVCYEVIFPGRVVDKNYRPYWLVNVTNDAWYGISAGPYQHFASAQMRAVEEGIPLARAANTGISGMIDAYGRVTASLGLGKEGIVDAGLPRRTEKPTFYGRFGNLVPLSFAALLLIGAFIKIGKRRK